MNAGKKDFIQAASSGARASSSQGTIASSSMSVNMSVDSKMAVVGGSPLLWAVSALTTLS